ncbi:MAG: TIGR00341 family protein [Desulfobacteraceae bacterium]|nr:TIGR00341 family protein [Desulfobacteraceae bacterium]MBC2756813.1 TIGR00341 family protein [Desulfobacteraceae bacterium]
MGKKKGIQISPARFRVIYQEIKDGSEPGLRFYILVAVSTLIAGFGLMANSTAVVIGAMLVAPLMTPIFGMSLALIRGNSDLLGKSIRAEIAGVVASIIMGYLLGILAPVVEVTPEMLARTAPNLFDLLVAVLAGFAGSYAMVDEKISPALPGVAIATAIVPPLANCGLCFALGSYIGGIGSFLLFFANFLSVLLVASITFTVFGLARRFETISKKDIIKRFGLAFVSFCIVAIFLTDALYKMASDKRLELNIRSVLTSEVSAMPSTSMDKMSYEVDDDDKLYVLAKFHSSKPLSPIKVKAIENRLAEKTGVPTELIIRCVLARDISAVGSTSQVIPQTLDGMFISDQLQHPIVRMTNMSEKVIRDYLAPRFGVNLVDVEILDFEQSFGIFATIIGIRDLSKTEVNEIEQALRGVLEKKNLKLLIRQVKFDLHTKDGTVHYEWFPMDHLLSDEHKAVNTKAKQFLENQFDEYEDLFLVNINTSVIEGMHYFLLELAGNRYFSAEEVVDIEQKVSALIGKPVQIYAWSRPEVVATADGYASYESTVRDFFSKRRETYKQEIKKIIDMMQ